MKFWIYEKNSSVYMTAKENNWIIFLETPMKIFLEFLANSLGFFNFFILLEMLKDCKK